MRYPSQTIQSSHLEGDGAGRVNSAISRVMYDLAEERVRHSASAAAVWREAFAMFIYACKRCVYVNFIRKVITHAFSLFFFCIMRQKNKQKNTKRFYLYECFSVDA